MWYEKIYVKVIAEFNLNGGMRPTEVVWKDGRRFEVERLKFKERAPCKTGGVLPVRYTVIINGEQKYLYFDRDNERFFVEREGK